MRRLDFTTSYRGGSGEPLVLIHGVTSFWETRKPLLPRLTSQFDVFAPTMIGHAGREPIPVNSNVLDVLVDDLEKQMDAAGITTAHIAGNSLGGWVAMELMRRGRARSVVALSPAGGWKTEADVERTGKLFRVNIRLVKLIRPFAKLFLRVPLLRKIGSRDMALHGDRGPGDRGSLQLLMGCG